MSSSSTVTPVTNINQYDSPVVSLAKELLSRPSVTPEDAGCQEVMIQRLEQLGFSIERLVFEDTTNLWARRGTEAPLFCFAGHTDVVPAGDLHQWHTPPFEPTEKAGYLYARGAADMKGSLASMVVAVERFVAENPDHQGSISFLITSDEEGPFINGTTRVIDTLEARNEKITWCIVGEPSSTDRLGDVIKNGRRGSLTCQMTVRGVQGHVAYPHLAKNPVHLALPALSELTQMQWDQGNDYFPPTSMQIPNLHAGTGAPNVVPGTFTVQINWRYSTELTAEQIRERTEQVLDSHGLDYELGWTYNGSPFLTDHGRLLPASIDAVEAITGYRSDPSTSGGTSDGRFIAPTGAEVIELGPCNATIHQVNECVKLEDLELLADVYQSVLERLLTNT